MNINSSINDSTFNPHKKPKLKILGFSIEFALLLLSISIMHIWISYDATKGQFNSSWHNLISVLLFTMILAEILKVIGKKIPILKDMGGGAIFCLLLPAFLFNYNFFPRNFEIFHSHIHISQFVRINHARNPIYVQPTSLVY
ncbi:MAG: 2-hydroxycarboxylate transporter family protein [Candidatus Phytoplasma australasiaticum]|nr:2-hydroxycarboxylate transporter family protein [Candidatus Phytoplasma australasiaticum]